jgi:hypothetical protein
MISKIRRLKLHKEVFVLTTAILLLCPLQAPASKKVENESSAWETSQSFKAVAKKAMPTVVFIKVEKNTKAAGLMAP